MTASYTLFIFNILFWYFLESCSGLVAHNQTQVRRDKNDPGICGSFDIRNNVHLLQRMRGCRVVEGFVQILLIEDANETDYNAYSFPELREITYFLLLYRVSGLKNLSRLFPNLLVIRGEKLFYDYAVVVYEMFHLQEIGLTSLTAILRGGVRIEKNRSLCFVNTISWAAMHSAADSKGDWENFIAGNEESCPRKCPGCSQPYCWSSQHCQRICPDYCGFGAACGIGVNGSAFCCHHECIGGCNGSKSSDCFSCRHVAHQGVCLSSCPKGTYRYQGSRCVSQEECFSILYDNHLLEKEADEDVLLAVADEEVRAKRSIEVKRSWMIPFDGECVKECPSGTEEDVESRGCRPCEIGACRKRCQGANVDSISSAQLFRGCTHVDGSLEIELEGRGGEQVMRELEEDFGQIEEISGYLKIVRCVSLVSLDFLRNLRLVEGKKLESDRFAIVVLDNLNLRRLWEMRNGSLTIGNGRLFFHFNPRLCLSEIEKLLRMANLSEHTYHEVNSASNGNRGDCYDLELHAHVTLKSPTMVTLHWQHFELNNQSLLGYTIHYMEVLENETAPEDRETCGRSWKVEYVMADLNNSIDMQEHNLLNLLPFAKYAYYIKTYTVASERSKSGRSKTKYFRTPPSRSSMPLEFIAEKISESSITLTWKPPLTPNGNIAHYLVIGRLMKEDETFLQQRDYCTRPMEIAKNSHHSNQYSTPQRTVLIHMNTSKFRNKDICSCREKITNCKEHARKFVDGMNTNIDSRLCVNAIYSYLQSNKLHGNDDSKDHFDLAIGLEESYQQNYQIYDEGAVVYFSKEVHSLKYNASELKNYGIYTFEVKACQDPYTGEGEGNASTCSPSALLVVRTLPHTAADSIHSLRIFHENGSHFIHWDEPLNANGGILAYNVEYQQHYAPHIPTVKICITKEQYHLNNRSLKLQGLLDGEYSIRVRANSLAGYGPFSQVQKFTVSTTKSGYDLGIIWGSAIGLFIMILVFGSFIYVLYSKNPKGGSMELKLIASVNPDYLETIPEEIYKVDDWEVHRSKVQLVKELGQGSFGMVYEGILENVDGALIPCAVKTVHEGASITERISILNEASVMKEFHSHHVVKLLGVISQGSPTLVIMELMAAGDLKTYLRTQREFGEMMPFPKMALMAAQVADGMAYLASHKFVHRDLAARNCLISADLTVKVGDFGMARDIYETDYYRKGTRGLLPVRWMAPESLRDGIFTSLSDVWSFGILVWEMSTLAEQPYQGITNQQVLEFVKGGGVMNVSSENPELLNAIMKACWKYNPQHRLNFFQIVGLLESQIDEDFRNVSFVHSEEGKMERTTHNCVTTLNSELSL